MEQLVVFIILIKIIYNYKPQISVTWGFGVLGFLKVREEILESVSTGVPRYDF